MNAVTACTMDAVGSEPGSSPDDGKSDDLGGLPPASAALIAAGE